MPLSYFKMLVQKICLVLTSYTRSTQFLLNHVVCDHVVRSYDISQSTEYQSTNIFKYRSRTYQLVRLSVIFPVGLGKGLVHVLESIDILNILSTNSQSQLIFALIRKKKGKAKFQRKLLIQIY